MGSRRPDGFIPRDHAVASRLVPSAFLREHDHRALGLHEQRALSGDERRARLRVDFAGIAFPGIAHRATRQ